MKNIHFICVLLVIIVSSANGQLRYGPHIGVSFSSFSTSNSSFSGNLGVVAGGMIDYVISPGLQLVSNLDYHQIRGELQSAPNTNGDLTLRSSIFTLHTAELTGLLAYRIPISFLGSATPKVTGGISGAYNFATEDKRSTTYYTGNFRATTTSKEIVTDSFSRMLGSAQAGLQFEFLLSDASFSAVIIDFRLRRNLNALMTGISAYGSGNASDLYSNSLIVTFGLMMN
jgi:hypothetical protein